MKPWVASLIRGLLITIIGFVGLAGLLMSACGLLLGAGTQGGLSGTVAIGFLCAAACLGIVIWVSLASERGLRIALGLFLGCLVILWFIWHARAHL
jgi:hypothetical protein